MLAEALPPSPPPEQAGSCGENAGQSSSRDRTRNESAAASSVNTPAGSVIGPSSGDGEMQLNAPRPLIRGSGPLRPHSGNRTPLARPIVDAHWFDAISIDAKQ